jgi:DNA-binding transcriptional MocR family regulator
MQLLDRKSPIPLWAQMQQQVRILLTGFESGTRFYSDEELAQRFNVNRLTARQAMEGLVREGLLSGARAVAPSLRSRNSPYTRMPTFGASGPTKGEHFGWIPWNFNSLKLQPILRRDYIWRMSRRYFTSDAYDT